MNGVAGGGTVSSKVMGQECDRELQILNSLPNIWGVTDNCDPLGLVLDYGGGKF